MSTVDLLGHWDRRVCRFCGKKSGSEEHIFPQWYSRALNPEGRPAYGRGSGQLSKVLRTTTRAVCHDCNTEWLKTTFEDTTSPLMKRMIRTALPELSPVKVTERLSLSAADIELLARYAWKMVLLLELLWRPPEPRHRHLSDQFYRNFHDGGGQVPPGVSIVMAGYHDPVDPVVTTYRRSFQIEGTSVPGPSGFSATVLMAPFVFIAVIVGHGNRLIVNTPATQNGHATWEPEIRRRFIRLHPLPLAWQGFHRPLWPTPPINNAGFRALSELLGEW